MPRWPVKRKVEEDYRATYDKRLRTAHSYSSLSRIPPSGTQYNPLEIESSPEPEEPEPHTNLPCSQLPVREWGLHVESGGPPFYAIAGSHVPGIYTGRWQDIQDGQLTGYSGNNKCKCKTLDEAWRYLEAHRGVVDSALRRPKGLAYLASIGKASSAIPQFR